MVGCQPTWLPGPGRCQAAAGVGSSAGSGLKTTFERDPVNRITFSANSWMVNSPGSPRLTGPIKPCGAFIIRNIPSIMIIHVAETPGLRAVPEHRNVLPGKRLNDEIAHHPAVVGMHARPVGVKDADHPDIDTVLPVIIEKQGFRAALAFIVAGAKTDGVYISPSSLRSADARQGSP